MLMCSKDSFDLLFSDKVDYIVFGTGEIAIPGEYKGIKIYYIKDKVEVEEWLKK